MENIYIMSLCQLFGEEFLETEDVEGIENIDYLKDEKNIEKLKREKKELILKTKIDNEKIELKIAFHTKDKNVLFKYDYQNKFWQDAHFGIVYLFPEKNIIADLYITDNSENMDWEKEKNKALAIFNIYKYGYETIFFENTSEGLERMPDEYMEKDMAEKVNEYFLKEFNLSLYQLTNGKPE